MLETERRLILGGHFADLSDLQVEKERLVARVEAERPAPPDMERLRARAESNLALLAAAQEGFAAAQARLRELERVARGVGGYDRRGTPVGATHDSRTSRRV